MSAIALFIQVPVPAIPGLRDAAVPRRTWYGASKDIYWQYLREHGRQTAKFDWSGYVFNTVLRYLDQMHGIVLEKPDSGYDELAKYLYQYRRVSHDILTPAMKQKYLDRLDPKLYPEQELMDFHNAFTGRPEGPEYVKLMQDAIVALHESLSQLEEGFITLLIIG
jgi:hypothetical protein